MFLLLDRAAHTDLAAHARVFDCDCAETGEYSYLGCQIDAENAAVNAYWAKRECQHGKAQWVCEDGIYCADCGVYTRRFGEADQVYSEAQVLAQEKAVGA